MVSNKLVKFLTNGKWFAVTQAIVLFAYYDRWQLFRVAGECSAQWEFETEDSMVVVDCLCYPAGLLCVYCWQLNVCVFLELYCRAVQWQTHKTGDSSNISSSSSSNGTK